MRRRIGYALLTALPALLIVVFVARSCGRDRAALPSVAERPEVIAGLPCDAALSAARQLVKGGALEHAQTAYLWIVEHCDDPSLLPDALLEAGSLFGHLLDRPQLAAAAYATFLRLFPTHEGAADATYHLAKLEIDAGNYAAAVAHLTALTRRYPAGRHAESARFLAGEAAEMLAADRRSQRTVAGQVSALVPNNLLSVLALMVAIAPSVIQTVRQAKRDTASGAVRWPWLVPAIVILLTLFNSALNNIDNARRNTLVMDKLDRLLEAQAQLPRGE
jgi:hypothetical protein